MEAILKFNLPEDKREYEMANQAADMVAAIGHFEDMLRSYLKYGHNFKTPEVNSKDKYGKSTVLIKPDF